MKRIKLVVFFILGLFMLTSCGSLNHESFPSGPQIEVPGNPEDPDGEVSSYLITYYENGLKVHQEKLESGKALPTVEATKIPLGQEFKGWSLSSEEYVPVDFDVMPEADVDLYAFYQNVKYTITFNANIDLPDGITTTNQFEYHERLGEFVPSDLQELINAQTEYVFVGWFLDPEFEEEFIEVSMPANDFTLYAKWQFSGIRFMYGLDVFYEVKDDEGTLVNAPLSTPAKAGYEFAGWVDAEGNAVQFPLTINDEVQYVYASFTPKSGISYKVEHYLENLNGTYVRQEVEELQGVTDTEVEALWKSYNGFTKDEDNENNVIKGIVNYNGTLVLKLYYSRNSYKVSFNTNGGSTIDAESYKYEQMVVAPSSPNKVGYTFAGWELNGESYSFANMPANDIELTAKWQIIEYTVTFITTEVIGKATYTVENKEIVEPAVPEIEHFTGVWADYELTTGNITVNAIYTPVTYTVTFKAEGVTVDTENYTVVNPTINEPSVPTKEHYTGVWESYVLVGGNVEVEAVYTPVTYYVTFVAEGAEVAKLPYTVENKAVVNPAVPAKAHYTGVWESYTLTSGNVEVEAVYTPVTYYVTFVAEGNEVAKLPYTVENKAVVNPAVPAKAHYTGVWESYTLTSGNVEVNAIYTPVTYTVTFKADGEVVDTRSYTVENKEVVEPTVPTKAHYTGVWETYTLTSGNVEVNAIYTPVTYTVTFKADGETVDVQEVTILDLTIVEPVVPAKLGYDASWETYTVALENIVVNAVYELVEYTITYNTNDGVVDVDVIIAEFLNDYNTARGKSHTVESFVELGSWGEISDASLFLYNSEYKAKWSWLVHYIANVASSANKPAYVDFFNYNSQSELHAANSNHIYRIAYELRGWVGQTQYTQNVNFKSADYSKAEVQEKLINYYFAYKYNVNTDTFELNGLVKEHYEFAGWYNNPEFTGDAITQIAKGSTGDQVLYAKFVGIPYYASLEVNGGQLDPSHYGVITDGDPTKTITIGSYSNTGLASGIYFCDKGVTSNNSLRWQYKILLQYDAELNAYEVVCLDAAKASANNAASAAGVTWTHALASANSNITTLVTLGQYIVLSKDVVLNDTNFEGYAYHASQISVGIKPIEFAIDREDVLLPTPTKEGFEFVGWYNNPEFTGEAITKIVTGTAGNLKLYAKFESLGYSININPNGGIVDDSYYQLVTEGPAKGTITISEYSNTGLASGIYFCDTGVLPQNSLRWQYKILLQYDAELNAYKVVCLDAAKASANNAASAAGVTWTHALSSAGSNITTLVTLGQYIVLSKDVVLNDTNFEGYVYDETQFVEKIKTMYYTVESEDIILPTPTKAHYDFNGWYDNPEFTGEAITKIAKGSTGNKQLYAKFTPTEYKVTFKSEVSEDIVKTYTIENPTIEEPTVPTKTGYTGVWESYTVTSGNIEVNAVYTINQYKVTFKNGSDVLSEETLDYGTTINAIATPTKDGYEFVGWSVDLPTTVPANDLVIEAKWKSWTYTYTFGANGTASHVDGSAVTAPKSYSSSEDGNVQITLTTATKVYDGGKDAQGNSALKLGTGSAAGSFTFTVPEDVQYVIIKVAQYKANTTKIQVNDVTYTITTPSNNGEYTSIIIDTSSTKTISFTTLSGGYRCMIDEIFMSRKELQTAQISFNSNGGSGSIDSINDLLDSEVSIPSSTGLTAPTNMKFDSWNTSADGSGISYQPADTIVLTSDLILYAIWVENDPVEMTISEAITQEDGVKVILSGVVQSIDTAWDSGYGNMTITLKDATGTITIFRMESQVEVGDLITVTGQMGSYNYVKQVAQGATAVITGVADVKVAFDANGGTGSIAGINVKARETFILPSDVNLTAPTGKIFLGWSESKNAVVAQFESGSSTSFTEDKVLYAVWVDDEAEEVELITSTVSISSYASSNNWVNSTKYTSLNVDSNITVNLTKTGSNTGKYYTSGTNWRMYQSESPTIEISAKDGYTIVSVKITYASNNTGCLTHNGSNILSGALVSVNASSVTFSVGNTASATNGQARITAIEVVYYANN